MGLSFRSSSTLLIVLLHLITIIQLSEEKLSENTQSNHDLLTKIGFSRIRAPNSHHRKRLAVESRQHSRSDDSHMFIIKLPPNQHYYVHNKPAADYVEAENSKNLPIGFKGNGKPGKIYHWNMPIVKKIAKQKNKHNGHNSKNSNDHRNSNHNNKNNIKVDKNWNDVLDKPIHNIRGTNSYKKPSYYIPSKPKKSSFFKYFPGNGKPQSFYVIEKNKKLHHHKLIS